MNRNPSLNKKKEDGKDKNKEIRKMIDDNSRRKGPLSSFS